MAWVTDQYAQVLICDGSTLESLIRKTGLLIEAPKHPLAGRMIGLLDACWTHCHGYRSGSATPTMIVHTTSDSGKTSLNA
jgi:hypothetical protein